MNKVFNKQNNNVTNQTTTNPTTSIIVTRKTLSKRLSTGQTITLTPQDDKTLKTLYDYVSGFTNRKNVEAAIEIKKSEVELLKSELSPRAKLLLKERANQTFIANKPSHDTNDDENESHTANHNQQQQQINQLEGEYKLDEYYKAKEQLVKLEERLKVYSSTDHKISAKDIDGVVRLLGVTMNKRQIEVDYISYMLECIYNIYSYI